MMIYFLVNIAIPYANSICYRYNNTCYLMYIPTYASHNNLNLCKLKFNQKVNRLFMSNVDDLKSDEGGVDYKRRIEQEEYHNIDFIDNKLDDIALKDTNDAISNYFDMDSINKRFPDTIETDGMKSVEDSISSVHSENIHPVLSDTPVDRDYPTLNDLSESEGQLNGEATTPSGKTTNREDKDEKTNEYISNAKSEYVTKTFGNDKLERGERPIVSGHGLDMECRIEDYEIGTKCGRLNEWPTGWSPGSKVMSFFPVLIDEYSLHPSPLQIGFEDAIRFRGKHVESTFNSLIDKLETTTHDGTIEVDDIYGICFLNPNSGQLAPLAVYAKLLNKKSIVDSSGETLEVVGRVLGRVMISKVILEEPFIKASITPVEDKPGLDNPDDIPKLVDEITNLHRQCNELEADIMTLLQQPYAVTKIKSRPNLHDLIDDKLNKFNINFTNSLQAFAQLAAYTAFDHHITAAERYDALTLQNSEDRLKFIRDCLKMKIRQLNILKNAPQDKLNDMLTQLKNFQSNRDELYNNPDLTQDKDDGNNK